MNTNRGLLARLLHEQLPSWWQQRKARKAEQKRFAALSTWEKLGYRKPSLDELCAYFGVDPEQFSTEAAEEAVKGQAMLCGLDFRRGVPGAAAMARSLYPDHIQSLNTALQFMATNALIDCFSGKAPEAWKL
jgi:hypothetical protein